MPYYKHSHSHYPTNPHHIAAKGSCIRAKQNKNKTWQERFKSSIMHICIFIYTHITTKQKQHLKLCICVEYANVICLWLCCYQCESNNHDRRKWAATSTMTAAAAAATAAVAVATAITVAAVIAVATITNSDIIYSLALSFLLPFTFSLFLSISFGRFCFSLSLSCHHFTWTYIRTSQQQQKI